MKKLVILALLGIGLSSIFADPIKKEVSAPVPCDIPIVYPLPLTKGWAIVSYVPIYKKR